MRRPLLGIFVMAALLGSGCASQREASALREEVNAARSAIGVIQAQQMAGGDPGALRNDVKTLSGEIAALEGALRDATVELSKVRARMDAVERAIRETTLAVQTLEERIAKLSAAAAPPPAPAVAAPLPSQPASPGRAPISQPTRAAEQAYAAALTTFRAREHGQAVLDFIDFIAKYPGHSLAPNAQYWIGEAYYVQRDFRQAILEFQKVLEFGLANPKVPDALLKIGLSYRNLRDSIRARQVLDRVIRDYPRSEAARKARALVKTAQAGTTHR